MNFSQLEDHLGRARAQTPIMEQGGIKGRVKKEGGEIFDGGRREFQHFSGQHLGVVESLLDWLGT